MVHCVENHDAAYYLWREAGLRGRIVVHIDAHHDLAWIQPDYAIHIGNYLCAALRDGIAREVYWVIPDPARRDPVERRLRRLAKTYPDGGRFQRHAQGQSVEILGRKVTACPLAGLPSLDEPVLLDVDTDYFVIPQVAFRTYDRQSETPWIWPAELVKQLEAARIRSDFTTIAFSVEGGFTPLRWKWLGLELAARLSGAGEEELAPWQALRECRTERLNGGPAAAATAYQQAWLARAQGQTAEAQAHYARALVLDPSYGTPFNSAGIVRRWERRFDEAAAEHRATLVLNPSDPWAHYGLAREAIRRRQWREAEDELRQALAVDRGAPDFWRELARAHEAQGRHAEAVDAYERSLKLALRGGRLVDAPPRTPQPGQLPHDPQHGRVYAALARLHSAQGNWQKAYHCGRIALAARFRSAPLLRALAAASWRLRRPRQAAAYLARSAPQIFADGVDSWRRRSGEPGW